MQSSGGYGNSRPTTSAPSGYSGPQSVSPYKVGLINLRFGDERCTKICDNLYSSLNESNVEVLYDDRDKKAGSKFADMDLIGLPWQIVIGPKGAKEGIVELKSRKTGELQELSHSEVINLLKAE